MPRTDSCTAATSSLFDHLVGGRQQGRRHRDAERLGGLEAYNEFKFGWLFDGKIARLGAMQNLVNIVTGATGAGRLLI